MTIRQRQGQAIPASPDGSLASLRDFGEAKSREMPIDSYGLDRSKHLHE